MSTLHRHLPDSLADVQDRLDCIDGDLARMPIFKAGSAWHMDRVREQEHLRHSLERLRNQVRLAAERN
jgi:hypothetical protein